MKHHGLGSQGTLPIAQALIVCTLLDLQYSSEILKHLCDSPLPNVDLGFAVISVLQNTRGSTLGKERGAFE